MVYDFTTHLPSANSWAQPTNEKETGSCNKSSVVIHENVSQGIEIWNSNIKWVIRIYDYIDSRWEKDRRKQSKKDKDMVPPWHSPISIILRLFSTVVTVASNARDDKYKERLNK